MGGLPYGGPTRWGAYQRGGCGKPQSQFETRVVRRLWMGGWGVRFQPHGGQGGRPSPHGGIGGGETTHRRGGTHMGYAMGATWGGTGHGLVHDGRMGGIVAGKYSCGGGKNAKCNSIAFTYPPTGWFARISATTGLLWGNIPHNFVQPPTYTSPSEASDWPLCEKTGWTGGFTLFLPSSVTGQSGPSAILLHLGVFRYFLQCPMSPKQRAA